jgi:hypothetical protein
MDRIKYVGLGHGGVCVYISVGRTAYTTGGINLGDDPVAMVKGYHPDPMAIIDAVRERYPAGYVLWKPWPGEPSVGSVLVEKFGCALEDPGTPPREYWRSLDGDLHGALEETAALVAGLWHWAYEPGEAAILGWMLATGRARHAGAWPWTPDVTPRVDADGVALAYAHRHQYQSSYMVSTDAFETARREVLDLLAAPSDECVGWPGHPCGSEVGPFATCEPDHPCGWRLSR